MIMMLMFVLMLTFVLILKLMFLLMLIHIYLPLLVKVHGHCSKKYVSYINSLVL